MLVSLSPIMASPFGGMLWHCHDMLAGFFPDDSIGKMLKSIGMGLEVGWFIVLLSFPYNVFCALSGYLGTVWLSKKLFPQTIKKKV